MIIPLLLFFVAVVISGAYYNYHSEVTVQTIKQNEIKRIKQELVRLQSQVRSEFGRSDASRDKMQHLIASYGSELDLVQMGIIGPEGSILFSLEKAHVGRNVEEVFKAYSSIEAEKMLLHGQGVVLHDSERELLQAYFPVLVPSALHGFSYFEKGVLYWHSDLERILERNRTQVIESIIWSAVLPMLIVIIFVWGVLHFLVAYRANRLVQVAKSVEEGDFGVRSRFTGPDELACLGKSLDAMADNLQKTWKHLQESEERFHIIFNEAADVIVVVNPDDGSFVEFNDRVVDLYGYTQEEFGRLRIADLEMIESGIQVKHHVERIMKSGSDSFETMHRSKEGKPLRVSVNARRIMLGGEVYILALFRDITGYRQAEENLKEALLGTVEAIARVSEKRNPFSVGHQHRVSELAVQISRELDLEEWQVEGVRLASLILDIGEISIAAEVLNRPSRLKPIEYELVKSHARSGYEIISGVEMPWPIATILLQHHERLDGSGYPDGLKYEEIAIEARIVAVADVVSAMMSHRPHRSAYTLSEVINELDANSGTLYDEEVVRCCFKVIQSRTVSWLSEGD